MSKFVAMSVTGAMAMPDGMYEVLKRHNIYRCMHGVQALQWDNDIADSAQTWATQGTCDELHHSGGSYGENIYWASPAPAPADLYKGVDDWYNEISYTDDGATSDWCNAQCGHYTQLVWAGTSSIGCGTCGGTMVCQYNPAGNYQGEFSDNVYKTQRSWDDCAAEQTEGHRIMLHSDNDKCLDLESYSMAERTKLEVWPCTGNAHQQFRPFWDNGHGEQQQIRVSLDTTLCFDVTAEMDVGSLVELWPCDDSSTSQLWVWSDDEHTFRWGQNTDLCMDLVGASSDPGTKVELYNCAASWNQQFDVAAWGLSNSTLTNLTLV